MPASDVASAASAAARSPWLHRLARLGLAARGVTYLVIGVLAVQVALGENRETDQNGALLTVARQPFGTVLLWLLALGFAGYAAWRFTEVALGETGGDPGAKGRLKSLVRGLAYASLCFTTVSLLTGTGNASGGSARQNVTLTARAMQHSWGRVLVGGIGAVLIGVGAMLVVEGVRRKFEKHLRMAQMSATTRTVVEKLGMFGTAARGLVFALAGFFLIAAAISFEPRKARGLDGALKSLARSDAGPWLLGVVALGLVAFGIYGLAEARYRRVERAA
ncbi:MAG: DUF1206 domain-containing protein [Mycobacteriales bacterium]